MAELSDLCVKSADVSQRLAEKMLVLVRHLGAENLIYFKLTALPGHLTSLHLSDSKLRLNNGWELLELDIMVENGNILILIGDKDDKQ